jgi:hypothetical protein
MVAQQILVLLVRVQILLGQYTWSLRLSARMEDSQSSERGSIPLGTNSSQPCKKGWFFLDDVETAIPACRMRIANL